MDSRKQSILEFIAKHPGVRSIDINVGLGRPSIGAHTRALMDAGLLIKDSNHGWHIAAGYVVTQTPREITPLDIAAECIRKMIDLK